MWLKRDSFNHESRTYTAYAVVAEGLAKVDESHFFPEQASLIEYGLINTGIFSCSGYYTTLKKL